ncbi:MAG: general secretion pathway protein GspK [Magnetococcales bacterium]|nr:general secretion pathway protein GspK [Magnetococcales bacterium]
MSRIRAKGQEGMVLLVTLSAIALLVPLVYAGMESQRFHLRQVQRELELEMAHRHAESLLSLVVAVVKMDGVQGGVIDHLNEPWAMPITLPDNPDGTAEALVEDTSRRWNLNALRKEDGQLNGELRLVLRRLAAREGLSGSMLERVVEWLVPTDQMARPETGGTPLAPEPLHALEELLKLPDWNAEAVRKLAPFITVDDTCRNSRLNLNTATLQTLEPLVPEANWQQVVERRTHTPIAQVTDLAGAGVALSPDQGQLLTVGSSCFVAHIRSRVQGSAAMLTAWLVRNGTRVTITKTSWDG